MTQVCVGNLGHTGAFCPKFFLEVVFAHTQIEHHVFNVQLFEQCFVCNSSLSPPPLLVHSSFSPSLLHLSPRANAYHLLPTWSTSHYLTQDAILSRPISPHSLAHYFSLLSPHSPSPRSPCPPRLPSLPFTLSSPYLSSCLHFDLAQSCSPSLSL